MSEPTYRLVFWRGKFAAEWYDETLGRQRRSLGTTDRFEAREALEVFIKTRNRAAMPVTPTVAYCWKGYLATLAGKPSEKTMRAEGKAVLAFFGDFPATKILEEDCQAYIAKRRAEGRKDGTIWTEMGRLRSSLVWAEKRNVIDKAPTIFRPERPPPRDLRMTKEQVSTFLDACTLPHLRLFVILAVSTAGRMGAILDLTWDRVNFETGLIDLRNPAKSRTKKGRALVPMNRTARAALQEAQRAATCEYVIEWGGAKVESVKNGLKLAGQRCGLEWVTAHIFRHSSATHMAEAGIPMAKIAQYLGHSDSRITEQVYARYSPHFQRDSAEALEIDFVRPVRGRQRE